MARTKTVTLRGAAAQAFIEAKRAEMEDKPKTFEEYCKAVAVGIHMDMASGNVTAAVLRLQHFAEAQRLVVTEGVSGMHHYHLSAPETASKGLCSAATMSTKIPLSDWQLPFGEHFTKKPTWCKDCEARRCR